ncbi:hypothetical protein ACJZ2D_000655 [Fusarium nematophilum]
MATPAPQPTKYAAYLDPETQLPRIGHYDLGKDAIQPLAFSSGTPITNLYQVIEAGPSEVLASDPPLLVSTVRLLPTISGRDVLAVGKNYMEHAREFNSSGFDSSDKVDRPSHPVIFTKRATSIIAHGEEILPHESFSQTVDYEGEIGVILGRQGFRIKEEDAWDYVWGFTIINDVTARERQRDHKQFFIGKSPDTFCPIGPVAVRKEDLPSTLRVQTHVNGELRQVATTDDLIFSIPTLVSTISAGQTIQPGDPAGVGIGKTPPVYLKSGDEVAISVTGLGTLRNKVASLGSTPSRAPANAVEAGFGLTEINGKPLFYKRLGSGEQHIVFVHGLGGSTEYWTSLVIAGGLDERYTLHLYDLEGHGRSPTSLLSKVSIESLAADLRGVFEHAQITRSTKATIIAHSMGCLVAGQFARHNQNLINRIVLLGPPPSPLYPATARSFYNQARLARTKGMAAIVDAVAEVNLSEHTRKSNPLAVSATRLLLLGQDPEGFAKGCWALANAVERLRFSGLDHKTFIITGEEDKVSPEALCQKYVVATGAKGLSVLGKIGHMHVFEDGDGVASAVKDFLEQED